MSSMPHPSRTDTRLSRRVDPPVHRPDLDHISHAGGDPSPEPAALLSVIIPTLNEERSLAGAIRSARQCPHAQIIVADGGSMDATAAVAEDHGVKVIPCEPGRGRQLIRGVDEAAGDFLLFLHADTRLPHGYAREVSRLLSDPHCVAGAFRMTFDQVSTSLRLIEWGANLRSTRRQMPYGDQAIHLRRSTYQRIGGFRPMDAMEDFDLIRRLRRLGRVRVSPLPVVTSARKYTTRGPWRTVLRHQRMIWRWWLTEDEPADARANKAMPWQYDTSETV